MKHRKLKVWTLLKLRTSWMRLLIVLRIVVRVS